MSSGDETHRPAGRDVWFPFHGGEIVADSGEGIEGRASTAPAPLDPGDVRCHLTFMKTSVSTKGQIVLPAELRKQDRIEPGQEFEVERVEEGLYRLRRTSRRRNEGLLALLLDCPVKGWFEPMPRTETTADLRKLRLG